MFAALATRLKLGSGFAKQAKSHKGLEEWLGESKPFFLSVICFDTTSFLSGETSTRWKKMPVLHKWEKSVRDAHFDASI